MSEIKELPTDRRAMLAGIGGFAAATFITAAAAQAGTLTPPGAPAPTQKPLNELEPRTMLSATNTPGDASTNFVITKAGSYFLGGRINVNAGDIGIRIAARGVTLDLNGFMISGKAPFLAFAAIVIDAEVSDVVVRNGLIDEVHHAIYGEEALARVFVEDLHVYRTDAEALFLPPQSSVTRCTLVSTGGISSSDQSSVVSCRIMAGPDAGISVGGDSQVVGNVVQGMTLQGINVGGSTLVEDNQVSGCTLGGIAVTSGSRSLVQRNRVQRNPGFGLKAGSSGNTFRDNIVDGNGTNYDFVVGNSLELLISQIPQTLDWPCAARLAGSLTGASTEPGITINASNVTLDLMGHTLQGVNESRQGVLILWNRSNIVIRNGIIRGWGQEGIATSLDDSTGIVVEQVQAVGNAKSGLFLNCYNASVRDCVAVGNGQHGIWCLGGMITGCNVMSNSTGIFMLVGTIEGCTARQNVIGIQCNVGVIWGCDASYNTGQGIRGAASTHIVNNSAYENNGNGFELASACTCINNTSRNNGAAGISCTSSSRVESNACIGNVWGIRATGDGNVIFGNTCSNNSGANYELVADNRYGAIIDITAPGTAAVSGSSAPSTMGTTNPWANFSH